MSRNSRCVTSHPYGPSRIKQGRIDSGFTDVGQCDESPPEGLTKEGIRKYRVVGRVIFEDSSESGLLVEEINCPMGFLKTVQSGSTQEVEENAALVSGIGDNLTKPKHETPNLQQTSFTSAHVDFGSSEDLLQSDKGKEGDLQQNSASSTIKDNRQKTRCFFGNPMIICLTITIAILLLIVPLSLYLREGWQHSEDVLPTNKYPTIAPSREMKDSKLTTFQRPRREKTKNKRDMALSKCSLGCSKLNNSLIPLMLGGEQAERIVDLVEAMPFTPTTSCQLPPMPKKLKWGNAGFVSGSLLVYGGETALKNRNRQCWILSANERSWRHFGALDRLDMKTLILWFLNTTMKWMYGFQTRLSKYDFLFLFL